VQGTTVDMLVESSAGVVTATPERVRSGAGGNLIEVTRVRITEAGRRAL
jgi:hypothetical protein